MNLAAVNALVRTQRTSFLTFTQRVARVEVLKELAELNPDKDILSYRAHLRAKSAARRQVRTLSTRLLQYREQLRAA